MRLTAIFRYELRLQLRRPTLWLYAATVLALAALVANTSVDSARGGESLFDAPVEVASVFLLATLVGLLVAAALSADTATRDTTTRMTPLFLTSPLRLHEYLGGRFLAALALYAMVLLLVPLGHVIARFLLPAELVVAFRPLTYVETFLFIALPNAFISTAFLFAVAALTRSTVASYIAGAMLLVGAMLSFQLSVTLFAASKYAGLMDPFAFAALRRTVAGWTVAQQNVRPLALEGELLWNRVAWLAAACTVLAGVYWHIASRRRTLGGPAAPRAASAHNDAAPAVAGPVAIPHVERRFGAATRARQTLAIAGRAFRDVATSWGALLIVGIVVFHVVMGPELMEHLGVPLHPVTAAVVRLLTAAAATGISILVAMLTIFYAGELVWKERDLRLAPLTGAAPVTGWTVLLGKFLGLAAVLAVIEALLVATGMVTQAMLGHFDFQPMLYVGTILGLQLAGVLLFAALAVSLQVIAGGKIVGWLAAILAWLFVSFANVAGVEHQLLLYGGGPGWTVSAMSGLGAALEPALWFTGYWAAWATLLAIVARLLLVRGMDLPLGERLRRARERFTRRTALGTLSAAGAVCGLGGFIFWNTNILNDYRPAAEQSARAVEYERRYGVYRDAAQPVRAAAALRFELYPSERSATVRGRYVLRNETGVRIDTIHVAVKSDVATGAIEFDRPARTALVDDDLGHRIYILNSPLAPGDSLSLGFALRHAPRGFGNDGAPDAVVANGTYFELQEWLPSIGYQPSRELSGTGARRELGLPPRPSPSPEDRAARTRKAGRELNRFHVVVGTDSGQTAVTPGILRRSWQENGRAYFEYEAAAPIHLRTALLSAEYAVHRSEWQGIPIEVLYHPDHPWNAERMARSVAASLEYFTRTIGPYPYGVVRVVQRPMTVGGATAFPGMVALSEPLALMRPEADARDMDFQSAVMAHEMAHQWWGNQFGPAHVAGAALLTESLAWYGAFAVVEETSGRRQLHALLDLLHEAYLQPMSEANPPLTHADNDFLGYRKGAFAIYAAREYMGEEKVTAALRRLFDAHVEGRLPDPTSLDLVAELKAVAPDSLQTLLHDLFEANVWWNLGIRRAGATQLPSGEWEVAVQLRAAKVAVDTLGAETALPLDELVEIVLHGEDPDAEPVYRRFHRISAREQTITMIVPELPTQATLDPRHLLVDRVADDNSRPVIVGP